MPTIPEQAGDIIADVAEPQQPELPELTLANVLADVKEGIYHLIFDPECNVFVIPILFMLESAACKAITTMVAFTDIDYTAYMEQIELIRGGELNYEHIYGGTGPLVYPAGHVWIYRFMYHLTQGTKFIKVGQSLLGWIYIFNQLFAMVVYLNMQVPPWVLCLLTISKRLHSIYVLRLFNDCFTTSFAISTVLALQYAGIYKSWNLVSKALVNFIAPLLYGCAISIKMNAMLYFPGFLVVTYFLNDEKLVNLMIPIAVIVFTNISLAYEFLFNGDIIRESYFAGAFNFKRKFLYEWTVNWRFLSEDLFNDDTFHKALLGAQVCLLLFFLFTKWASPKVTGKTANKLISDGLNVFKATSSPSNVITHPIFGPRYIASVMMASNFIGVVCSRSLHYQFLSWYAWTLPYLIYSSGLNGIIVGVVAVAHEWCWNVYPSTTESSMLLLAINVAVLVGYWYSSDAPLNTVEDDKKEK